MEFRNGDGSDNTDVIGNPRKDPNDVHRHDQEFYIYHVEGAGGPARIALQNVNGANFLNNHGNGSSNGYVQKGLLLYLRRVTYPIYKQGVLIHSCLGIGFVDIAGMQPTHVFSESSSHSKYLPTQPLTMMCESHVCWRWKCHAVDDSAIT